MYLNPVLLADVYASCGHKIHMNSCILLPDTYHVSNYLVFGIPITSPCYRCLSSVYEYSYTVQSLWYTYMSVELIPAGIQFISWFAGCSTTYPNKDLMCMYKIIHIHVYTPDPVIQNRNVMLQI